MLLRKLVTVNSGIWVSIRNLQLDTTYALVQRHMLPDWLSMHWSGGLLLLVHW